MATQPCAALDAVLAKNDWAQLVLRPLLVTDATWSVTDAAKALARVECVCRALRRAVEPLWWRTLVVQRWPSAALVMPQRRGSAVPAPPVAGGAWRRMFRQRHIAALNAPPSYARPSATSSLAHTYDFSVELTLDGQPFASTLLPGANLFCSGDELSCATATGALTRTNSGAAPRLRATLFAHRSCQPADPARAGSNRGTAFACVLSDAAAVQPGDTNSRILHLVRDNPRSTPTTVVFGLPLRRNDDGLVLHAALLLSLDKPPEAAAPGGAGMVQEGGLGAAALDNDEDDDALVLRHVSLQFVPDHPSGAYFHRLPNPDMVHAALALLQWEAEVLRVPPQWGPRRLQRENACVCYEPRRWPYWVNDRPRSVNKQ
jgi:hypothetical protein